MNDADRKAFDAWCNSVDHWTTEDAWQAALAYARPDRAMDVLREFNQHFEDMQGAAIDYLVPDSNVTHEQFANNMIYALDGPGQRRVQDSARRVLDGKPERKV